jgi:hypothetical protein
VPTQFAGQITVKLDHRQGAAQLAQWHRQGTQAGANLHHGFAGARVDGPSDAVDDGVVGQEVLAKALAGDVADISPRVELWPNCRSLRRLAVLDVSA